MERRKAEAQSQLQKLKEECEMTVGLLNKIILASSQHVNELEKLDTKDFRLHSKYFLAVSQFQYISHQKLLEVNVDLEEHLLENNPPDLEHFKLVNCRSGSSSFFNSRESESNILSPTGSIGSEPLLSKGKEAIKPNNDDVLYKVSLDCGKNNVLTLNTHENSNGLQKCLSTISLLSQKNTIGVESNEQSEEAYEAFIGPKLAEKSASTSSLLSEADTKIDKNESSSDYFNCVSNQDTKSQNSREPVKSDDSFYSDTSFYEEPESLNNSFEIVDPLRITERLKSLPVKSVEEKCTKNLPMPDLSLKPAQPKSKSALSNNTSSKSSINSDAVLENVVEKRKKKRLRVRCNKENEATNEVSIENRRSETKVVEIQSRPVPKVGDVCMIGLMESPSKFYIQVADENSDLLDLWSDQLEDIYGNSYSPFSSKTEAANVMGNFGCLQIESYWYRVEVIDWKMDATGDEADMVRVQLVDYGNKDVYSYHQLRPLTSGFCHVPKMAQLCHLAYLYPPGSTKQHRKRSWSKKSLGGFYSICGDLDHSYFRISYIYVCDSRKSFEVDIVKQHDNDEEHSIGQILINTGFAVEIIDDVTEVMRNHAMMDQIRTAQGMQGIGSDMSKEEILDRYFQHNIPAEASNVNEAVMHYNPRDEAETCRNLRPDGTCYKGPRCKWRHVPLRDGFTRDRELVYQEAFTDAPLPRIDDEILLTISHIEDIQCFYAQMRTEGNQQSFIPTINQLIKTMNSADNIKMYKNLQHPPCPNQLVIAKHWNTYWYRAQVRFVQIPENNDEVMAEVYFVDFGDKLEIPMSDLRTILPDFLQLPFQAIECRLFNVKHKDDLDREEEKRYFELQYLSETLRAKVVAVPGHLEVLLKNNRDEDVGLQLIEDGYGVLNTQHDFPAENELILID